MTNTTDDRTAETAGQIAPVVLRLAQRIQRIEHNERHTWHTCDQSARNRAVRQAQAVIEELAKIASDPERDKWRNLAETYRDRWKTCEHAFAALVIELGGEAFVGDTTLMMNKSYEIESFDDPRHRRRGFRVKLT